MNSILETLQRAVALHREGRVAEARALYRWLLCQDPSQDDTLHLLGLAEWRQNGDVGTGVDMMGRAVTVNPSMRAVYQNLVPAMQEALQTALGHHNAGRRAEAERLYLSIVRWFPDHMDALHLLARLYDNGDPAEMEKSAVIYRRLTTARPQERNYWIERGYVLDRLGRTDEARAAYAAGVGAPADSYPYCIAVANALFTHRERIDVARQQFPHARLEKVVALLEQALTINPHSSEARLTLARIYRIRHQVDRALTGIDGVLALNPRSFEGNLLRSHMLYRKGRLDEALAGYQTAVDIAQDALVSRDIAQRDIQHLAKVKAALAAHGPATPPDGGSRRIPIIFIHFGYNDYLIYTMAAARLFNPDKEIILIGDDGNRFLSELGIRHVNLDDYRSSARMDAFHKVSRFIYGGETVHDQVWNQFCFERWFILQDFTEKHGYTRFWVFDSDTLLLAPLSNTEEAFFGYDWTLQSSGSNIGGFVGSRERLESYLDFMTEAYGPFASQTLQATDDGFSTLWAGGGALDDMALYYHYSQCNAPNAKRLSDVVQDSTFSDLIWQPWPGEEWERDPKGVRSLYFDKGYFSYNNLHLGKKIRLNGVNLSFVSFDQVAHFFDRALERFSSQP